MPSPCVRRRLSKAASPFIVLQRTGLSQQFTLLQVPHCSVGPGGGFPFTISEWSPKRGDSVLGTSEVDGSPGAVS